jgi:hypothetical protein
MSDDLFEILDGGLIRIANAMALPFVVAKLFDDQPDAHHVELLPTETPGVFVPVFLSARATDCWLGTSPETGRPAVFVVELNDADARV